MEIKVDNVNSALSEALRNLAHVGVLESSRNGPVLVFPEPVLTVYTCPRERVLFNARRDANPFFHLMEALWMLAGRNDLAWIAHFNRRFSQYSDDGVTFHAAYGHRWFHHFGYSQLDVIAQELKRNPNSRRMVLTMWDPHGQLLGTTADAEQSFADDLKYAAMLNTKDAPCNTHAYFEVRDGALNLTVCCRSNDIWYGAYGANAVHFSVLLEVMAAWTGVAVGVYRQFSNNLHLYTDVVKQGLDKQELLGLATDIDLSNLYTTEEAESIEPFPIVGRTPIDWWFADLHQFMKNPLPSRPFTWRSPFFRSVAVPMFAAWNIRKEKRGTGMLQAAEIEASDWRKACMDWIVRRENEKIEEDSGVRPVAKRA